MIPLNFHHLYYFYTVAKAGSIARATESLLLAQPTISAQIKALERFLKRPLFERRNRRLVLTEDGRLVMDYAESIFELGREMEDAVRDRRPGGAVAVQLGVVTGTPRAFALALVEKVFALSPESPVSVKEGSADDMARDLRDQRLDLVLSTARLPGAGPEEFPHRLAGRAPIHFVGAPALARRIRRWPADLEGAPLIVPGGASPAYREVLELLDAWKVRPKVVAQVDDVEIARRLAVAGRGLAPLNAATVAVGGAALRVVEKQPTGLHESVYLVSRRRKYPNPVATQLEREFKIDVS